ncbi:MAG: hypothetical protein C4B58_05280 [Deltaproteobacteria bacterium]|nr:MAG: hypothetical protein C4B58_05280 [Deltaproteobacteria bacterium]
MNMNKRLDRLETQANMNREAKNELEMIVNAEGKNKFFSLSPDGKREKINYAQAMRLMDCDKGTCEVQIIE